MTPRDLFAVAVRIIGIIVLVYGLLDLVNAGLLHYEYFKMPDSSSGFYVIAGCASIIIGLYLTSGASHLVNFAYPYEEDVEAAEDENVEEQREK